MKRAIILCSGGLDSVTVAHYAKKGLEYEDIIILFFSYGQRNLLGEKRCAKICAHNLSAKFYNIQLNHLKTLSTSLLNTNKKSKDIFRNNLKDTKKESEKWYVPCRNILFLNYAASLAESLFILKKDKYDLFVGFKNEGKEFYPDTTKKFVNEMNKLLKLSTISKPKIFAPFIRKDKEDIVLSGERIDVDFKDTFSCYTSFGKEHCGKCLACMLRKEGFYWANKKDPTLYALN